MTERSRLWTTNNTGDGPTIGYSTTDWEKIFRHWFQGGDEANGGVLFGIGNLLACTGSVTPIALNTGAAMVYGHYYENDASLNLAVTTPVVGLTGGRVVLRVNHAAQTVRAFTVRNTDGVAALPALTQSAGTTWEISLASFTITTGGAITLTDTRKYVKFSTKIYGDQLDSAVADGVTLEISGSALRIKDGGVSTAKLADLAVNNAKLAANAVSASKIQDGEVSGVKLAANSVSASKIQDGEVSNVKLAANAVGTSNIANDAVTDAKIGVRVPKASYRQGGSATDWSIAGTVTQTVDDVLHQCGALDPGGSSGNVTFPVAFSNVPIIFIGSRTSGVIYRVSAVSTTTFNWIRILHDGTAATIGEFFWLAIGPGS